MSRRRALIVCPGRGSYTRESLGSLASRCEAAQAILDACDSHRAALGRPTVRELDAAASFRGTLHVAGEHASLLTFACSLADLAQLDHDRYEVVGVCGNSMGWYTALAASGALDLADAIDLVETMASYQAGNIVGGQIMLPLTDAASQRDPSALATIEAAIQAARAAGGRAWWSIDLGSHAVLAGDEPGLKALLAYLPTSERGGRTFPAKLPLHSAFHTPLLQGASEQARLDLAHLHFQAPDVPLIDGRGNVFRPLWADPDELADYTLGKQVTAPYDFHCGVVAALGHCAPDVVIALGPGNALGGPLARILTWQGWAGLGDGDTLWDRAAAGVPVLISAGLPDQAPLVGSP